MLGVVRVMILDQLQVLWSIVGFDAVDVMNDLCAGQIYLVELFVDVAMFKNTTAVRKCEANIPHCHKATMTSGSPVGTASLPIFVTSSGTELVTLAVSLKRCAA